MGLYRRNKYGNKKTIVYGITFDSKKEASRYQELKFLELGGKITELHRQVPFELIPKQTKEDGKVERAVNYVADFTYWKDGKFIVEDAKGFRTPDYILKRKMMLEKHGITIREV